MKKILVTGAAGFIGFHVSRRLLSEGVEVVGWDNLNDYYSVALKRDRLAEIRHPAFRFEQLDVADWPVIVDRFDRERFDAVVHLAAQAGVRHSLKDPRSYIVSNLAGFGAVLEGCRQVGVKHLVYASSSSVYGANRRLPFSVHDNVDHPLNLYAASKKANELMAHSYSALYALPATGLRFFTVYGPWGRPDMAVYSFTEAIVRGRPIDVYNHGRMRRDFTYVDDIVEGIVRVLAQPPHRAPEWSAENPDPAISFAPHCVYNIGNHQPVELLYLIETLERCLGRTAEKRLLPMQPGDVLETAADIEDLRRDTGFYPHTPIEEGVRRFVEWYAAYHGLGTLP